VTASSGPRQDRLHLLCFDAQTGKLRWHRQFWATGSTVCNPFAAVAAPSPASDGRYVVAMYSSNDLVCFDLEGHLQWLRGLGYEHPHTRNDVGMASSPLLVGPMVVVQCETFGDSFAAAIRLADGKTLWQSPRAPTSMWASPVWYEPPGGTAGWILMHSRSALTALDPQTGREAWRYEVGCHSMASSVVVGDRIVLPGGGMQCLRWDVHRGQPVLLWRQGRLVCGAPSPAVVEGDGKDGKIYTIRDPGILQCGRLADGQLLWQLRLQGPIWATPVISGNHLYAVSHGGLVQVVQLPEPTDSPQKAGRVVHTCQLDEGILATPALADGAIYFRSDRWLWKFALPAAGPTSEQ
jgi:outer membrane protein assembly factor BamB